MRTLHIARYVGVASFVLLVACAAPSEPGRVRTDSRSICQPGHTHCQSRKPEPGDIGDKVQNLPKSGAVHHEGKAP